MSKAVRVILTVLGGALAACLFSRLFAHAGAAATWRALGCGGPFVLLALVPFALGMTLDACGTIALLRALGRPTTLAQMLPVRFASEALHLSIPAGFVASDTATALLLASRARVPIGDGVVASIARKWLVMRAHAGYIALGALGGFAALAALSERLIGKGLLPWAVLASAAIPLGGSWAVGAGLLGRSTFAWIHGALARVPSARLGRWLVAHRSQALATDAQVARLRASTRATTAATLWFFGAWCVEALESVLLLQLVGADVAFLSVVAIEGGLSLVRSLAVVAPSGLGVVDLGYATVLPALGADTGAATAFVLLKRAKEIAWVATGYVILGAMREDGALFPAKHQPSSRSKPLAISNGAQRDGGLP
jgi:uncharacterized membrane protein YbhN (UPF0104 family)